MEPDAPRPPCSPVSPAREDTSGAWMDDVEVPKPPPQFPPRGDS